jgi:hypothetical protein
MLAIIIGSTLEAHLIGTVVEASFHSNLAGPNDEDIPLYATYPPQYRLNGEGPILFQSQHLALIPPDLCTMDEEELCI